jgi:hypothetical protein
MCLCLLNVTAWRQGGPWSKGPLLFPSRGLGSLTQQATSFLQKEGFQRLGRGTLNAQKGAGGRHLHRPKEATMGYREVGALCLPENHTKAVSALRQEWASRAQVCSAHSSDLNPDSSDKCFPHCKQRKHLRRRDSSTSETELREALGMSRKDCPRRAVVCIQGHDG